LLNTNILLHNVRIVWRYYGRRRCEFSIRVAVREKLWSPAACVYGMLSPSQFIIEIIKIICLYNKKK
jgi:hypothetical protein